MMRRDLIFAIMSIVLVLPTLAGCLDDGDQDDEGIEGGEKVTVSSDGGSYVLAGGKAVLSIPEVDGPFEIVSSILMEPPSDPGLLEGSAVVIEPDREINRTCTLTLAYDPSTVPDDVDESELVIGKVIDDFWAGIRGSTVDRTNHTVTVAVTHFSSFGIMAPKGPRIGPVHSRVLPGQSVRLRVYQEPLSGGTLEYEWTCTDKVGGFNKFNPLGKYVTYQSEQDREGEEKLSVEVFEKVGGERKSLGIAYALIEVRYTTLMITPYHTQILHDTNTTFIAFFAPELDDTVSLKIQWWNTGKNGILSDGALTPGNYLETSIRTLTYMAGPRGGYWDKIDIQVNIDMGSGMGGFKENALTLGSAKANIYVFDINPSGSIPHRENWGNTLGNVTISTYHPKPGELVSVTVTWEGGPDDKMGLFCAGAVAVSGSFDNGPVDLTHPSLGGSNKGGPDVLDCTHGGLSVVISGLKKSVVFEIDSNISRSELIHTWTPNQYGGTTFHGPAVILWTGGTFAWGSGRMFEIDASGVIPPMPD